MDGKWQTSLRERISYGLSDGADNLVFQVMTTYLLYFYTDIYGLSAAEVGMLFLIARFADVIESVLIGVMIDHTHSKYGHSRPFFLWYAVPYVTVAILTFVVPPFNHTGKLVWAYGTYLLLGFFYSTVNLPITSILPSLTDNSREITLLGVIRQFFGQTSQIIVAIFTLPLIAFFGGNDQQRGFLITIIVFAAISLILILNTFVHVRERIPMPPATSFKKTFDMILHNKPWLTLSAVIFLYWVTTSMKNQTTIYYFKYNLNKENLVPVVNAFTAAALIGIIAIPFVTRKFSNKATMMSGLSIAVSGQLLIIAGSELWPNLTLIFIGTFINTVGSGMVIALVSVMISDTIKYAQRQFKVEASGLMASTDDFGVNLGLGLGGMISAALLAKTGYVANQSQNQATLHMITLNYAWLPLVAYILMMLILSLYDQKTVHAVTNDN
ncbi:Na+ xyloside symporter or related transporter [Agrilactobacillus composti DSM 18527 = JCM 14202]|uniref:Na+ xyloside symporter or related transporter n=1 Tax=Agrilactobacillus composti DSM 18527 = JCM 14202 TaxID=1423734 RepID=X0PHX5_9LACO|nr:MFS transporter [Agrilactobacillus composti]KRM35564.1 Na+ xyloside symporter or related transporter [Agrilactobacillus composti DSM 18527 = JCM 14202]GAF41633.1 xyloside transporter XynT [Agrilactobacillus composti DSM 18527 = JCM 14202]